MLTRAVFVRLKWVDFRYYKLNRNITFNKIKCSAEQLDMEADRRIIFLTGREWIY